MVDSLPGPRNVEAPPFLSVPFPRVRVPDRAFARQRRGAAVHDDPAAVRIICHCVMIAWTGPLARNWNLTPHCAIPGPKIAIARAVRRTRASVRHEQLVL